MNTRQPSGESCIPALTLFLTGTAPRSQRARANLAHMLEQLGYRKVKAYEIDLLQQPEEGMAHSVFATPALLKTSRTGEVAMLYGDLSDEHKLRRFLSELGTGY
ncbi:circadian clock KaiB family protein [Guyparkeria sp.]|uniref:circadian clock KaiB family protein n=1 Tax=Guyparkeria sp. TaxID=2035736 RepID=UPI0039707F86